jgi:hypothetical protein
MCTSTSVKEGVVSLTGAAMITWVATAIAIALCLIVGSAQGFEFVFNGSSLQAVLLLVACPLFFSVYGVARPAFSGLVTPFHSFAQVAAFNSAALMLQFPLASFAFPRIDDVLVRFDGLFGADFPVHFAWMAAHPLVLDGLVIVYRALLFQVPLVCLIIGVIDPRRLAVFVLANTIGLAATVLISIVLPAGGAFYYYGHAPYQVEFVAQFHVVREGTFRVLDPEVLSGIISFPSYHTVLAVLIAIAFLGLPRLFPVVAAFEAAIVFSARPIGGHYYADLAAGIVVAFAAYWAASRLVNRNMRRSSEPYGSSVASSAPSRALAGSR